MLKPEVYINLISSLSTSIHPSIYLYVCIYIIFLYISIEYIQDGSWTSKEDEGEQRYPH